MEEILKNFGNEFVPSNYLALSIDAKRNCLKRFRLVLEKKKIPEEGWIESEVEEFIRYIASLDTNNFNTTCGVGEREGRIACPMVARRHFNFSHGIGRSGDLLESQPKAAGSSLLSTLVNALVLDYIKNVCGIRSAAICFIVPVATGMALSLCFLSLRKQKPEGKYILWSRIDQKSAFKTITTSGLIPVIIEPIRNESGELCTNLDEFQKKIIELGASNILCLYSTTSCFAPRNSDLITELSVLAESYNLFHIVNNAYGLQSSLICHKIEESNRLGRLDLFIQSTDKNFLVPVGGAIIAGFDENQVKNIAKTYVGRASSSQSLDVLLTLLCLGKIKLKNQLIERKQNFQYLLKKLNEIGKKLGETVIQTKNPISVALTLSTLDKENVTKLGSMLFKRGITGVRVVSCMETKIIDKYKLENWGSHFSSNNLQNPYITAAAALGIKKEEIEVFIKKIQECFDKIS